MKKQRILANGITFQVYEYSSVGEPLFFIHPGGCYSSFIWKDVISSFTDSYRVLAMDLRGHGESDQPNEDYALETMAEDVHAVLQKLSINNVHLVGNSLGADVAMCFASRYPNQALSITLIDNGFINFIGPDGEHDRTKESMVQERLERSGIDFASREDFIAWAESAFQPWSTEMRRAVEAQPLRTLANGRVTHQQSTHIAVQVLQAVCDMRQENWYPTVSCPVLFLPAELEPNLEKKLAFIEKVKQALSISKTVVIPGSRHIMMIEHAPELCSTIGQFLQEIESI